MTYRYYLLGETVPVRVAFNETGLKIGAEIPSRDKQTLIQDATYLSRLEHSFEVDEITEDQFAARCLTIYERHSVK